jgi:hypothetical protein
VVTVGGRLPGRRRRRGVPVFGGTLVELVWRVEIVRRVEIVPVDVVGVDVVPVFDVVGRLVVECGGEPVFVALALAHSRHPRRRR